MFLGSGISQSINCLAGIQGQASPHPIVTTASNGAYSFTSSRLFECCFVRSYPNSAIASIAFGLILPLGFDPALYASISSLPYIVAKACDIWLLFEFSIQTNNNFF